MLETPVRIAITGNAAACLRWLAIADSVAQSHPTVCTALATQDLRNPQLSAAASALTPPAHCYPRLSDLLAHETVDAVIVASPLTGRHKDAQTALYSACHVLTQTPLAITVRAAVRLLSAAEENERLLAVFNSGRFSRPAQMLKWAISEKIIGDFQFLLDTGFGQAGVSPNLCFGGDPKRHDIVQGGGLLFNQAMPDLAFIRYCFGDIVTVTAQLACLEKERVIPQSGTSPVRQRFACQGEDTAAVQVRFAGNAHGNYLRSWSGKGMILEQRRTVWGYGGAIDNDILSLEKGATCRLETKWKESVGPTFLSRFFPGNITNPQTLEFMNFLEAIAAWSPGKTRLPPHHAKEALRDLAVGWAAAESHQAGRRINVTDIETLKIEKAQEKLNNHWRIE